jgi:hypothetical protein
MSDIDEAFRLFGTAVDANNLIKTIQGNLIQELDNEAYRIRALAPQKSGRLRNSIQLLADTSGSDLSVIFEMVNYGYYQAFGVDGRNGVSNPIRNLRSTQAQRTNPFGIETDTGTLGDFTYQHRKYGLPATLFFDYNQIETNIANMVERGFINILD